MLKRTAVIGRSVPGFAPRTGALAEPLEARVLLSLAPVLDSNPRPAPALGAVAAATRFAVYPHDDSVHGLELWATDGTPAGTAMVMDIRPGAEGSQPAVIGSVGGTVYFTTDDGSGDQQLWATDGTAAATRALHRFGAAEGAVTVSNVVGGGGGGVALFTTYRFGHKELWKSNGTEAGTALVASLPASGFIDQTAGELDGLVVGGTLFFRSYDASGSLVLWESDGTPGGTHTLQPPDPAGKLYSPSDFLDFNGRVMFTSGSRWWLTDGTPAGTRVAAEVPGNYAITGAAAVFDGRVFFGVKALQIIPAAGGGADAAHAAGAAVAAAPGSYTDLWCTDGTPAGTHRVSNPQQPSPDAASGEIVRAGDFLYFTANARTELWRIDSADAEPVRVERSRYPYIQGLVDVAGELYFLNKRDDTNETLLFRADAGGLHPVPFAPSAPPSANFGEMVFPAAVAGDRVFIDVHAPLEANIQPYSRRELWSVANDEPQATLAAVPVGGTMSSEPLGVKALGGRVFFNATEHSRGDPPDLWSSDGTAAGTDKLMSLGPIVGRTPAALGAVGGFMMFTVYDDKTGTENLWRSDGTAAGTTMVRPPSVVGGIPVQFGVTMDGVLYFVTNAGSPFRDPSLWKSDGTDAGTVLVKRPNYAGYMYPLVAVGHTLYFFQQGSGPNQVMVWKSDGTPEGSVLVRQVDNQYTASDAYAAGDRLFFTMGNGSTWATWTSDGTAAGTVALPPALNGQYASAGGNLYLLRSAALNGPQQLFRTDGTEAGTVLLKEWGELPYDPTVQYPAPPMMESGGVLYFVASDATHGAELWKTDGTVAGTAVVRDLAPGAASARPRLISGERGVLVFSADDQVHGRELWRTDGTPGGTVLLADIQPGHEGSNPYEAAWGGGTLFVSATTAAHGWELFPLRPEVTNRQVFYNGSARDTGGPAGDDETIAADKSPLLPGARATYANLTSYTRGLNGLVIDVRNPRGLNAAALSPDDFEFRAGASGDPATWATAPAPASITVRSGAGEGGADRVTLTWPDGAIKNTWLRVTVKATAATGLASPDVFYFGNLVGKGTGGAAAIGPAGARVSALDLAGVRRSFTPAAAPGNPFDFNRDGRVNVLDLAATRANLLRWIAAPAPTAAAAPVRSATVATSLLADGRGNVRDPLS
jgi:ELWxxDGT repeat protein